MSKQNETDYQGVALYTACKLKGLAHLLDNYDRHSSNTHEEKTAWGGVSLILQDLSEDIMRVSEYLDDIDEPGVKAAIDLLPARKN